MTLQCFELDPEEDYALIEEPDERQIFFFDLFSTSLCYDAMSQRVLLTLTAIAVCRLLVLFKRS